MAAQAAADKKASDIAILEMGGVSDFTDYFIICDGDNYTQVQAITDSIDETMRRRGVRPLHVEGYEPGASWILMDYDDFIVHVFTREVREHYGIEKLWMDAPRIKFEEDTSRLGRKNEG